MEAVTETLRRRSRLLGLQLFHFISYVKFALIFYEVLFLLGSPKRTPMRQNARQSISTDKATTGARVKLRPLFLTHYYLAPTKIFNYPTFREDANRPGQSQYRQQSGPRGPQSGAARAVPLIKDRPRRRVKVCAKYENGDDCRYKEPLIGAANTLAKAGSRINAALFTCSTGGSDVSSMMKCGGVAS